MHTHPLPFPSAACNSSLSPFYFHTSQVIKEVPVTHEVPIEIVKQDAVVVPCVKIVEVNARGQPELYQRTGGGYKVWHPLIPAGSYK